MRMLLYLLLFPVFAFASGDDLTNISKNKNTTTVTTDASAVNEGVSLTGGKSEALAFAHGLGDVDINQCMGSTQWGTIIISKQKLVLNKWCAAEVYDAKGMYLVAAKLRCEIPEIAQLFDTSLECTTANTWGGPGTPIPPPGPDDEEAGPDAVGDISEWGDGHPPDEPEIHARQQVAINTQEEEIETLAQRIARIERGNQIAAQKAAERREYIQQTINDLKADDDDER